MPRRQQGRRVDEKFASTATSSPRSGAPRLRGSRATVGAASRAAPTRGERLRAGPLRGRYASRSPPSPRSAAAALRFPGLRAPAPVAAARPPKSGVAPPFGRAPYLCSLRSPGCASNVTFALGDALYIIIIRPSISGGGERAAHRSATTRRWYHVSRAPRRR